MRLTRAAETAVPALAVAAFCWISLRFAMAFGLAPASLVQPAALALVAGVALLAAVRTMSLSLTDSAVVRELDRRACAEGRLIAALEFTTEAGSSPRLRGEPSFVTAAIEDGEQSIAALHARVPALFPLHVPAAASRALVLLLLAPIAAWSLHGRQFERGARNAPAPAADPFLAHGDELARAAETLELPTMAWVVRETRRLLEPLRAPGPLPTPVAVALAPTPVPVRGASITDPEARAFFEEVLSGATSESVGREIQERFTGEFAAEAFKKIEREFKSNNVASGQQYEPGGAGAGDGPQMKMPKDAGGGMGGIAPVVDPSKVKSDYIKDPTDIGTELASALKESFDEYLREFAAEMLKGLEDALEQQLSGNGKGPAAGNVSLKGLPNNPQGLAQSRDPHAGPGPKGPKGGPAIASKEPGGAPSAAISSDGPTALGGTAAGGSGAGAGAKDAAQTAGAIGTSDAATGEKLALEGTLDERLAVVEVIRRMSGDAEEVDRSAAAEVVRKSTKAAEAEAAGSEDVPEEYRRAVESYFKALTQQEKK